MFGKKVHFIGVGGISMSALMKISKRMGAQVSGSDRCESSNFDLLKNEGYDVYVGERADRGKDADIVVYNSAIKSTNAELVAGGEKCVKRADFLAEISELFEKTLAISGTHGKTTVSAMLSCIFFASGMPFSAHIGGIMSNFDDNMFVTGDKVFVTEACEYKDSFLSLSPDYAIVLNIENDHNDYFKDIESIYKSFGKFVSKVKDGGFAVLGENVYDKLNIQSNESMHIYSFGKDFRVEQVSEKEFILHIFGEKPRRFMTNVGGEHNIYNAGISAFTALKMGVDENFVRLGLAGFLGVKRRYQFVGYTSAGAEVITDYAHHPSELRAVIKYAKSTAKGRIIAVFEPHTYSRTKALFSDFVKVLSDLEILMILPTYSAREVPEAGVDAQTLYCACKAKKQYFVQDYEYASKIINNIAKPQDKVLLFGAGSIENMCKYFQKSIEN